ncbi:hypothetical protein [Demequina oxidasica]|uniref:hypothetical protein n=1 Tax=Demequina oxidasica TaxID=676199 RepID=UPI000781D7C3|nr:hypothetical protein [Demequina oxidasica]
MSTQAREALRLLVAAMETHLDAVATRRSPVDAAADDAYDAVAEAFEVYEEALDVEFAESLPLVLEDDDQYDDDEDDDEGDEDDDADATGDDGEEIDPHAEEDEDDLDDDLDEFDLR